MQHSLLCALSQTLLDMPNIDLSRDSSQQIPEWERICYHLIWSIYYLSYISDICSLFWYAFVLRVYWHGIHHILILCTGKRIFVIHFHTVIYYGTWETQTHARDNNYQLYHLIAMSYVKAFYICNPEVLFHWSFSGVEPMAQFHFFFGVFYKLKSSCIFHLEF